MSIQHNIQQIAPGVRFTGTIFDYPAFIHSKQSAFHRMPERIRVGLGGNKGGKTTMGGAEAVFTMLGNHPFRDIKTPNHGWIVSEDHMISKNIAEKLIRQLIPKELIADWDWQMRKFTLVNGSTAELKSCDSGAEKFASDSKDWIWFDEPPKPKAVHTECQMRLTDSKGYMWITMTPVEGRACWTYSHYYLPWKNGEIPCDADTGELDFNVISMSTYDNPGIDKKEIDRRKRGLAKHEISARIYGEYDSPEGQIFPEFDPAIHVVKHEQLQPLALAWNPIMSMDHGASVKGTGATAAYIGALRPDGKFQVHEEYYEEKAQSAMHHAVALTRMVPAGIRSIALHLDRTATQFKIELQRALDSIGSPIYVVDSNSDHNAGRSRMREMLTPDDTGEPGIVFSDQCQHILVDLPSYRYNAANKKDHSVDAVRYLCMGAPTCYVRVSGEHGLSGQEKMWAWLDRKNKMLERRLRHSEYGEFGMG